jgi:hypothetical protein
MTEYQTSTPLPVLQPLPITLPAQFEQAFGLQIPARWVGLYWEPQLNQACYTDGETVGLGSTQAWHLFCTHPAIQPLLSPYQLGDRGDSAQHYLVLDRQNQQLYVGEVAVVNDYLRHPAALELLAQLDQSHRPWQAQLKAAVHKKWPLALAGLLSITLGFGLLHAVGELASEVVEEVVDD